MTKLQLTLTNQEADLLSFKAGKLGYNLTKFIKFLIGREAASVVEDDIPVFKMSKKAERIALKALQEYQKGQAREIRSLSEISK